MNKIILVGNLTRDPELATIPNGTAVCKFALAVNRRFSDADGNRQTDFFNVIVWRKLAESCAKYLRKGKKCGVIGQLQTRTYEDSKTGEKRYVIEIMADEVEFLSPITNEDGDNGLAPVQGDSMPF